MLVTQLQSKEPLRRACAFADGPLDSVPAPMVGPCSFVIVIGFQAAR